MKVTGIDFGGSGGAVTLDRALRFECVRFKKTPSIVVFNTFVRWAQERTRALCEQVSARPKDKRSLSRLASFMRHGTGRIEGFIIAAKMPHQYIQAKVWQYEFNLGGKQGPPDCDEDEEYRYRKRAHHAKAKELALEAGIDPDLITYDLADAFLIALYNWRKTFGELTHGTNGQHREATGINWERYNANLPPMRTRRAKDSSEGAGSDSKDFWI